MFLGYIPRSGIADSELLHFADYIPNYVQSICFSLHSHQRGSWVPTFHIIIGRFSNRGKRVLNCKPLLVCFHFVIRFSYAVDDLFTHFPFKISCNSLKYPDSDLSPLYVYICIYINVHFS